MALNTTPVPIELSSTNSVTQKTAFTKWGTGPASYWFHFYSRTHPTDVVCIRVQLNAAVVDTYGPRFQRLSLLPLHTTYFLFNTNVAIRVN